MDCGKTRTTTLTVRLSGTLSAFVSESVGESFGETGAYENVSEYIRDLIRRDKERAEAVAFDRLRAELTLAFAAPDESYQPLTARQIIAGHAAGQ
jgi:antitoxin ParD1/3/4